MLLFITALLQQNDLMIGRQIIKHVYYLLLTEEDCIFIGLCYLKIMWRCPRFYFSPDLLFSSYVFEEVALKKMTLKKTLSRVQVCIII